jgi:hypothetical protein
VEPRPVEPEKKSAKGCLTVVFLIFGGFFVAGGLWELNIQRNGTPAKATVSSCDTRSQPKAGSSTTCRGVWRTGDLLAGGEVVTGTVSGAAESDVGKEIDVRVRGDTAHAETYRIVYVSFAIAAAIFVLGGFAVLKGNPTMTVSPRKRDEPYADEGGGPAAGA